MRGYAPGKCDADCDADSGRVTVVPQSGLGRAMAWREVAMRGIGYWDYMETPDTEPQAPPDEKPPPEVPDQPGTSPGEPGEPSDPS